MANLFQKTALECLKLTRTVWRQRNGEPLESAFARVFGRPLPPNPLLSVGIEMGDRFVTVHLHEGGIAAVFDPASGGWELRAIAQEHREQLGNRTAAVPDSNLFMPTTIVGGQRMGTLGTVGQAAKKWVH